MRSLSLLVLILTVALVGCGAPSGSSRVPGRVTLTWWDYYGDSPTADRAITALLSEYQAAYPEIEVKRTTVTFADFPTRLDQAAAAGTFPDIVAIDNADVPTYAARGVLTDLTSRMRARPNETPFPDIVRHSGQVGDIAYGIPFRSHTTALWYNKSLFVQAGVITPPTTWDELRADARKLTANGHYGFCFAAAPTEEGTLTLLPLIWQAGGDVSTIGDRPSVDALSLVDTLVNDDRSAPESVRAWGQSEVAEHFVAGQCAMMINGPWVLPSVATAGFDFDVAPWPAGANGTAAPLGGEVLVVGRNTRHLDAAWHLTTWLTDPTNTRAVFTEERASRARTLGNPVQAWDPDVQTFAQQMRTARPLYVYGAQYPQISQAITTMQQQVLTRQRNPSDAAAETSAKLKPLLPR